MSFSSDANKVFDRAVADYHISDNVDAERVNPFPAGSLDHTLYDKVWIDAVQWHLEDIIRDPAIDPVEALAIKRRIDRSNQDRTDMVEEIDSYFLDRYKDVATLPEATINTESPAWAIDRLAILAYEGADRAKRRRRCASRQVPGEARRAPGAASRPLDSHRHPPR